MQLLCYLRTAQAKKSKFGNVMPVVVVFCNLFCIHFLHKYSFRKVKYLMLRKSDAAKLRVTDRESPFRGSLPETCRACASSPTTRLSGSTPSDPLARPSCGRRVCYMVISCAPASSHSLTSTVNLMGLPRISSPGSNGSTVGSSGCSFSGSTLPAPSEKSSV